MEIQRTITAKGIMPSQEACDTTNTDRPIQARALMHMKHSTISPWPVPELTGVQWVEPLPQASYNKHPNSPPCHLP